MIPERYEQTEYGELKVYPVVDPDRGIRCPTAEGKRRHYRRHVEKFRIRNKLAWANRTKRLRSEEAESQS